MTQLLPDVLCDGCEKKRGNDTNHWLIGIQVAPGVVVIGKNRDAFLSVVATENAFEKVLKLPAESIMDFCGEACTIKWVSKMLTEIKKDV